MANNYDPTAYLQSFFQNLMEFGKSFDINKVAQNYSFDKMRDIHQKTMDSSNSINQMISSHLQSIMSKQSEILQKNTEIIMAAVKEMSQNSGDTSKLAEKQSELYKQSIMHNMQYAKEFSELCAKANLEIFNKCMCEMQNGVKECSAQCTTSGKGGKNL